MQQRQKDAKLSQGQANKEMGDGWLLRQSQTVVEAEWSKVAQPTIELKVSRMCPVGIDFRIKWVLVSRRLQLSFSLGAGVVSRFVAGSESWTKAGPGKLCRGPSAIFDW